MVSTELALPPRNHQCRGLGPHPTDGTENKKCRIGTAWLSLSSTHKSHQSASIRMGCFCVNRCWDVHPQVVLVHGRRLESSSPAQFLKIRDFIASIELMRKKHDSCIGLGNPTRLSNWECSWPLNNLGLNCLGQKRQIFCNKYSTMFTIPGWLNPQVQNARVPSADCRTWVWEDFGIHGGSWNRSPADSEDDCILSTHYPTRQQIKPEQTTES